MESRRMKRSLWCILGILLLMACTPKVPSQFIQPSEMENILYDYHLAQAMVKEKSPGESNDMERSTYFQAVLRKHGVTEAEFDSSMVYYYSNLVRLKDIYKEVNERLADDAKELGAAVGGIGRYSQYSTSGDTANVWNSTTDVLLIPYPTMNRFEFTVKADTSYRKGDSFMFQFMSEYIWQSGMKDAVVCLVSQYEGDSIIQTVNHVSVSGLSQIRVPANRENKLREMRGFIYLGKGNDNEKNLRKLMFISQIQLIRFHNKEVQNETTSQPAKTDSVQRSDNARRTEIDTVRARNIERIHSRPLPIGPGTVKHGVADRAN